MGLGSCRTPIWGGERNVVSNQQKRCQTRNLLKQLQTKLWEACSTPICSPNTQTTLVHESSLTCVLSKPESCTSAATPSTEAATLVPTLQCVFVAVRFRSSTRINMLHQHPLLPNGKRCTPKRVGDSGYKGGRIEYSSPAIHQRMTKVACDPPGCYTALLRGDAVTLLYLPLAPSSAW